MNPNELTPNFKLPDPWPKGGAIAMAATVLLLLALLFGVKALAHLERDCNEDGDYDIYGVAYTKSLPAARHEFEHRGVSVQSIEVVQDRLTCNGARTYVANAWKGCRCRHFMFSGNWDYSIAGSTPACTVYGIQGEFVDAPADLGYVDR